MNLPVTTQMSAEPVMARRGLCAGCGQRPEDLQPIDAVAALRLIQRRSAVLLRPRRFGSALAGVGGDVHAQVRRLAVDPAVSISAERISAVLATADRDLRLLLGEQDQWPTEPAPRTGPPPATGPQVRDHSAQITCTSPPTAGTAGPSAPTGCGSVADTADRIVRTITGATTEDWNRRRDDEGGIAAELVWLAVHDATHQLDDLELVLSRVWAVPATPGAGDLPARRG